MSYYFYLRQPESTTQTSIMMRIRASGQIKLSTGLKVLPQDWDQDKQRVKSSDMHSQYKNVHLTGWSRDAEVALLKKLENNWKVEQVRDEILRVRNRGEAKKPVKDNSLLEYYHNWATTKTQQRNPTRQNLLSWNIISEFQSPISFSDVTHEFYEEFCAWMDDVKHYKTNMKGTQIASLRAVMNAAYREGLHDNTAYQHFKKTTEEVDNVYLNEDELDALYNLPLTGYRAKARDIFLVGCYTAMRWSDYSRLSMKDIVDDTIYFTHKKTGFRVSVPLHPIVKEVLERYGGAMPPLSSQKLNDYIKKVCRQAGITSPVTKVYRRGGVRVEETVEKCDLVTSHTARRTAATNMYKSGVPAYNIMLITGHTSEQTFRKYIKFEKEKNAELMRDNPYFKKR